MTSPLPSRFPFSEPGGTPAATATAADDDGAAELAGFTRRAIEAGFEVRVQHEPIALGAEFEPILRKPEVGAIANFIGVVRRHGDSDDVIALEIEHYPGMTEQSLWTIVEEASARWPLETVRIVHRTGRVALGQAVVLVIVAAPHRQAALDACAFLMDFLKTYAPFWKKEIHGDGHAAWVAARTRDEQAAERWG
ncbi:molybdenum cofactor biosynthesis protein MoaE [Cupriavidus sp. USMAA2-4]|uniref:molybdenum cofactor biosynthesis protein MoaE n=1 Tax=Cupriavidus sp. USMAA2-4 TaxID=876364 RepID=UPI0008A68DC3|nr:molybdenum cofactor biosynthesis protein MoaE [Cupriavidus sp. USMAA2-4]